MTYGSDTTCTVVGCASAQLKGQQEGCKDRLNGFTRLQLWGILDFRHYAEWQRSRLIVLFFGFPQLIDEMILQHSRWQ